MISAWSCILSDCLRLSKSSLISIEPNISIKCLLASSADPFTFLLNLGDPWVVWARKAGSTPSFKCCGTWNSTKILVFLKSDQMKKRNKVKTFSFFFFDFIQTFKIGLWVGEVCLFFFNNNSFISIIFKAD